jgi:hypothetical protein
MRSSCARHLKSTALRERGAPGRSAGDRGQGARSACTHPRDHAPREGVGPKPQLDLLGWSLSLAKVAREPLKESVIPWIVEIHVQEGAFAGELHEEIRLALDLRCRTQHDCIPLSRAARVYLCAACIDFPLRGGGIDGVRRRTLRAIVVSC